MVTDNKALKGNRFGFWHSLFLSDKGKFMAHHLNHMELGGQPQASSDHSDLAEDSFYSPYMDPYRLSGMSIRSGELLNNSKYASRTYDITFVRLTFAQRSILVPSTADFRSASGPFTFQSHSIYT